jgi:hypothetical protein
MGREPAPTANQTMDIVGGVNAQANGRVGKYREGLTSLDEVVCGFDKCRKVVELKAIF